MKILQFPSPNNYFRQTLHFRLFLLISFMLNALFDFFRASTKLLLGNFVQILTFSKTFVPSKLFLLSDSQALLFFLPLFLLVVGILTS